MADEPTMIATAPSYTYPGTGTFALVIAITVIAYLGCLWAAVQIAKALEQPGAWARFRRWWRRNRWGWLR